MPPDLTRRAEGLAKLLDMTFHELVEHAVREFVNSRLDGKFVA